MSEFHELWRLMERIYPSQVVPPLPEKGDPGSMEKMIGFAIESILEHSILREDEYFRSFLEAPNYSELVPMIKNVDGPVQVKREYFRKAAWKINKSAGGMARDVQYLKICAGVDRLFNLSYKLKQLVPLLDRFNYECGEVKKASAASSHSIRHLLYLNKSMRVYAEDGERVRTTLEEVSGLCCEDNNFACLIKFIIKYIENCEGLMDRLDRFRSYLSDRRDKLSILAGKLEKMQMPTGSKPSFDQIYRTKKQHEQELDDIAVVEIAYEKFSELVEREIERIYEWTRAKIKNNLIQNLYSL